MQTITFLKKLDGLYDIKDSPLFTTRFALPCLLAQLINQDQYLITPLNLHSSNIHLALVLPMIFSPVKDLLKKPANFIRFEAQKKVTRFRRSPFEKIGDSPP